MSKVSNSLKNSNQVPWRQQNRTFPYPEDLDDMLEDPQYIKDRQEMMSEHVTAGGGLVHMAIIKEGI